MEKLYYKSYDGVDLYIDICYPQDDKTIKPQSMLILFFGGGWNGGTPGQFHEHAKVLSEYGVVVALPYYRTYKSNDKMVDTGIKDATHAVEYLTLLAEELGVPEGKIILGGESAGGHLALSSMLLDQFISDDLKYRDKIGRMLLLNPVVDTVEFQVRSEVLREGPYTPEEVSPLHHGKKLPPMMIFHGDEDPIVPVETLIAFDKEMKRVGTECKLIIYPGRVHGFVNYRPGSISDFYRVVGEIVEELYKNDFLELDIRWDGKKQ